jgi:hypothetical protein
MIPALVIAAVLLLILLSRRGSIRRPEQAVPYIIKNFDSLTERDFTPLETKLAKICPASPERDLVYALRVSIHVRGIKNLKTLGSRWSTANFGAGARGLQMGKHSRNYKAANEFLTRLYLNKFSELATAALNEALTKKTPSARINSLNRAKEKIRGAFYEFTFGLPGLDEAINRILESYL